MELPNDTEDIDFEQIIYESQPIHKIEQLSYNSLHNHSQQFRLSYKNIEREDHLKNSEVQQFHSTIVKLITMIQPSKVTITQILEDIQTFVATYYPEDSKFQLRKAAKQKNILVMNKLSVDEEKQLFMSLLQSLDQLKRRLLLRQSQLGMVLFIEDNSKKYTNQQFATIYETNFSDILEYVIPTAKCFQPINYFMLEKVLEQECIFYEDFQSKSEELKTKIEVCQKILEDHKVIKSEERAKIQIIIKGLKVIAAKINTIADLFPYACIKSQEDLFSKEKNDVRWLKLFTSNVIQYKIYGDPATINQSFDNLKANLNIVNAAMNIMDQANEIPTGIKSIGNLFESFGKVLQVALSKSVAHREAEAMIADPNEKLAKNIWNLPERKQFKTFIELSLPSIEFSIQCFIPRLTRQFFKQKVIEGRQRPLPDFCIKNHAAYFNQLINGAKLEDRVSIRINNYFTLALKQFQHDKRKMNFFEAKISEMAKNIKEGVDNIKNKFRKPNSAPKAVIFHIHGGGFISMSSFIHQTYTRNWANNLQIPIVSVDYGKAPEHPFPEGLEDCLQAYLWTLYCMKQLYDFQPQRIILVGDSAGGNLVASLVNLLIDMKLRIPDGIALVYPALNLNYYDYSPSLLTALNDMILPHTFLKICLKSYLKDPRFKPDENYLVSPILTPNRILKHYPPTKMFVGSKDPFHDDCCRFAQKLNSLVPGRVHLKIFQQFPHGFLQFDMKNQPHYYCQQATKEVESALRELASC